MKTYTFCPVADRRIDEKVARVNAAITVLALVFFGLTQNMVLIVLLAVDFFLKSSNCARYSPVAFLSRKVVGFLDMTK